MAFALKGSELILARKVDEGELASVCGDEFRRIIDCIDKMSLA